MKYHYSTPILASIFRFIGALGILAALASLALVCLFLKDSSGMGMYSSVQAVFAMIVAIVYAIINFGIAQIIDCVAKTAYHTEHTAVLLKEIVRRLPDASEPTSHP